MENIFHIVFNRKQKSRVKVRSPFAFWISYYFEGMKVENTYLNQKVRTVIGND